MVDLLGLSVFNASLTCRIIVPEQDLPASASCTRSHDDVGLPGGCVSLGYVVKCKKTAIRDQLVWYEKNN
jgi:hypothetical protein